MKNASKILLFCETDAFPFLSSFTKKSILQCSKRMIGILSNFGHEQFAAEIFLITDKKIAFLNKKFMGRTGPTNVLSFPGDQDLAGSIMISLETCERESLIYGQPQGAYFVRLLAHGFAHLAGFGHGFEHDRIFNNCVESCLDVLELNSSFYH